MSQSSPPEILQRCLREAGSLASDVAGEFIRSDMADADAAELLQMLQNVRMFIAQGTPMRDTDKPQKTAPLGEVVKPPAEPQPDPVLEFERGQHWPDGQVIRTQDDET